MSNEIRGAGTISDDEFLKAYNNPDLNNQQVLDALNTDWTAIGVKLRSVHLGLHRTGVRTGGAKGSFEPLRKSELAYEAKLWLEHGTIQPKRPGYEPMTAAEYKAAAANGGLPEGAEADTAPKAAAKADKPAKAEKAEAPAADKPRAETTTGKGARPKAEAFQFNAEVFGTNYTFRGEDGETPEANRAVAVQMLFDKLADLNFSKVQITDRASGRPVGINELANGGSYRFGKQLTAA